MAKTAAGVQIVLVTAPTKAVARRIAALVVKQRLAACVNIIPAVESVFRWEGKVQRATEALLVIKGPAAGFGSLRRAILALHPYEVPEVIALSVSEGHPPYLRWVTASTRPGRGSS